MRVTDFKKEGSDGRLVLTGMIVSGHVLGAVAHKWTSDGLFDSTYLDRIGGWCVKHWNKFGKAPGKAVLSYHRRWSENRSSRGEEDKAVEEFLSGLSDEYIRREAKTIQSDYVIQVATDLFTATAVRRAAEQAKDYAAIGKLDKAVEVMSKVGKVDMTDEEMVDVLEDRAAVRAAFTESSEPVVVYPGAAGDFFRNRLKRRAFVAFEAPEKRGKCVSEDMEVVLADGSIRTIKQIVRSRRKEKVLAYNEATKRFQPVRIDQLWSNGVKECWRITTRSGRVVETTDTHQYLTPDGWKFLKDIKPGTFVAVPKRIPVFGTGSMNSPTVRFLSYMLAEGCCVKTYLNGEGHGYACSFTNADPVLVKDFQQCCERLGVKWKYNGRYGYGLSGNARRILRTYRVLGHSAKTKTLPKEIFALPKSSLAEFLAVFFSCDGSIFPSKSGREIELTLANEKLVRQIGHLLTRFGIVHRIDHKAVRLGEKTFDAWRLSIRSTEYVNLFLREINFLSTKYAEPGRVQFGRSFIDKLPPQEAGRLLDEFRDECPKVPRYGNPKSFYRVFGRRKAMFVREQINRNQPLMRKSFAHVADHPVVRKYLGADVMWDEVVSVKGIGKKRTYDLGVKTFHNFVCNDFVVHNSFWILDVAWRAMQQGRKVAYFELGDMPREDVIMRLAARASGRPVDPAELDASGTYQYPISLVPSEGRARCDVVLQERAIKEKLTWEEAWESFQKKVNKYGTGLFKLSCSPTKTLSVAGMVQKLERIKAQTGWVPDLIACDYADIFAPVNGTADTRDQINATWAMMRSVAMSWNALVVTATQSNRTSYDAEVIDMDHTADDKRKLSHATMFVGINQDDEEKEKGLYRLNIPVARSGKYNKRKCLTTAACLAVANPCVRSVY